MASQTVKLSVGGDVGTRVNAAIRSADADHVVTASVGSVTSDGEHITVTLTGPIEAVQRVVELGSRYRMW